MTVMVTGAEWLNEPDVPVTIKLSWDAGVCPFVLLLHPIENSEMRSNNPSTLIDKMLLRVSHFRLRVVRTVPNIPMPGSRATMPGME